MVCALAVLKWIQCVEAYPEHTHRTTHSYIEGLNKF